MKIFNVHVPKTNMLIEDFIAGENITANQIVMISTAADNTVLIATAANRSLICGVALNDALIAAIVRVCIFGVVEVVAGTNLSRGDRIIAGSTPGLAYVGNNLASSAGSSHNHVFTGKLMAQHQHGQGVATQTVDFTNDCIFGETAGSTWCGSAQGCEFTSKPFAGSKNVRWENTPATTHTHPNPDTYGQSAGTPAGNNAAESIHTHGVVSLQVLGKMLEDVLLGASGKCLVCLA